MPLGSRPPPLPKGVPHPYNSIPRPPGPPPKPGLVWGQGKWRHPRSQAAKFLHKQNSQRVQKALLSPFQGKTVYAYSNIRTKQVVYSLTRVMNNTRALSQLLYHGKKTRPSSLRRDMWTPHFSVQFPSTHVGRLAYARLRELSLLHQLCPEESKLIATEEHLKAWEHRMGDEAEDEEYDTIGYTKQRPRPRPTLGLNLPKKERARILMDQKATSVADLAFVLELQAGAPGREEEELAGAERRVNRFEQLGQRAQRRALDRVIQLKQQQEKMRQLRADHFSKAIEGGVSLDKNNRGEIEAGVERKRAADRLKKLVAKRDGLAQMREMLKQQISKGGQDPEEAHSEESGPIALIHICPDDIIERATDRITKLTKKSKKEVLDAINMTFEDPSDLSATSSSSPYNSSSPTPQPHRARHFLRAVATAEDARNPRSEDRVLRSLVRSSRSLRERLTKLEGSQQHRQHRQHRQHLERYQLPYARRTLKGVKSAISKMQERIEELDAGLQDGSYVAQDRGVVRNPASAKIETSDTVAIAAPSRSSSLSPSSLPTIERPSLADGQVRILWSDLRDAEWVRPETWPAGVAHGRLERRHDPARGRSIHVIGGLARGEEEREKKEKKREEEERMKREREEERGKKEAAERRFMREEEKGKGKGKKGGVGGWLLGGVRERLAGVWKAARGERDVGRVV